jgi:hypothetical protein
MLFVAFWLIYSIDNDKFWDLDIDLKLLKSSSSILSSSSETYTGFPRRVFA